MRNTKTPSFLEMKLFGTNVTVDDLITILIIQASAAVALVLYIGTIVALQSMNFPRWF